MGRDVQQSMVRSQAERPDQEAPASRRSVRPMAMGTWRDRVAAAQVRGGFTEEDREDASRWSTCPVGEQHTGHPMVVVWGNGAPWPEDPFLEALGDFRGFDGAVQRDNVAAAWTLLDQIEDRVRQLRRDDRMRGDTPTPGLGRLPVDAPQLAGASRSGDDA